MSKQKQPKSKTNMPTTGSSTTYVKQPTNTGNNPHVAANTWNSNKKSGKPQDNCGC